MKSGPFPIPCSGGAQLIVSPSPGRLDLDFTLPGIDQPGRKLFLAIEGPDGSAIVPFGRGLEGSTVFLPFSAAAIFVLFNSPAGSILSVRPWRGTEWGPWENASQQLSASFSEGNCTATLLLDSNTPDPIGLTVYAKDLTLNNGWGQLLAASDIAADSANSGFNDQTIPGFHRITAGSNTAEYRTRLQTPERVRIYQLFVRLFGNLSETRKRNGTLAENGAGKFDDINDAALSSIRDLGCTHIWLTGILRQMTATDYSAIGLPADDPDLLKGIAGSPYALKDCFDISPDYARDPARRMDEFKALLTRIHAHGLRAIIDIVPNHVGRSYLSTVRPDLSFGEKDDPSKFFDPNNNFFYLRPTDPGGGPPLRLPSVRDGQVISPTCQALGAGDGIYEPESLHGRVTGNNVVSWCPGINDWYETVKLNYGVDFTNPSIRVYPHSDPQTGAADCPVPDTWLKLDQIIAHWQAAGVDGFRCDMAHMVPPEFWAWAVRRARQRQPDVWFMAEAYNNDPAKLPPADPMVAALDSVMDQLLCAGFNAVYDDPTYKAVKGVYDWGKWANDITAAVTQDFIYQNSLRYAENHDEVRLNAPGHWGGIGMEAGRAVAALLFGIGAGPIMIYNGQEIGETGSGKAGFGCDDTRTTIFDYWSMPELIKWANHHQYDGAQLSEAQKNLRAYYAKLLKLTAEPGLRFGAFRPLNPANLESANFGRVEGDPAAGHWLYAFLRHDPHSSQSWLIAVNLHPKIAFQNIQIRIPQDHLDWLDVPTHSNLQFTDHLNPTANPISASTSTLPATGLILPTLPPLTAIYSKITATD